MHEMKTIEAITQFIFCADEPSKVDCALVLGSPSISNIEPAVDLYHAGLTSRILISGHGPDDSSPAEWCLYRDWALAQGVADRDLLIEPHARNTRENFMFSERIIAQELSWERMESLAICCKPIHARRAFMTARMFFPKRITLLILPPSNPRDIQACNWWLTERGRDRVMGEIGRIGDYGIKEHLSLA